MTGLGGDARPDRALNLSNLSPSCAGNQGLAKSARTVADVGKARGLRPKVSKGQPCALSCVLPRGAGKDGRARRVHSGATSIISMMRKSQIKGWHSGAM
jgi:hypothetical protein